MALKIKMPGFYCYDTKVVYLWASYYNVSMPQVLFFYSLNVYTYRPCFIDYVRTKWVDSYKLLRAMFIVF